MNIAYWSYRMMTRLAQPGLPFLLQKRAKNGKEDPARMQEKLGYGYAPRPSGSLLWIHGASIGESLSALPLIDGLQKRRPEQKILVTTTTITAAQIMAARLPKGVSHQYLPFDAPGPVRRFLDHWRPDIGFLVESELWPNLIYGANQRNIAMILVNGRLSSRSFTRWRRYKIGSGLFALIDLCFAQDEAMAQKFRQLGARQIIVAGNLKFAAAPLPSNPAIDAQFRHNLAGKQCWLGASLHLGEERVILQTHDDLRKTGRYILTILAPRHPQNAQTIAKQAENMGFSLLRHSQILRDPTMLGFLPQTDIYLMDMVGELGLCYRLAAFAFIGASLVRRGGHNPIEAIQLDCAVMHGPYIDNFAGIYQILHAAHACIPIHFDNDSSPASLVGQNNPLSKIVHALLDDPEKLTAMNRRAHAILTQQKAIVPQILSHIAPFLAAKAL